MVDINEMLRKITPHQDTDGHVMVTAEADDWRMLREYIAGLSAEVDAHSDLLDQSDRIEVLEAALVSIRSAFRSASLRDSPANLKNALAFTAAFADDALSGSDSGSSNDG